MQYIKNNCIEFFLVFNMIIKNMEYFIFVKESEQRGIRKISLIQRTFLFRDSLYLQLDLEILQIKFRKDKGKISFCELIQLIRLRVEDLKYSIQEVKEERN